MWWFFKRGDVDKLQATVQNSFENVRRDNQSIFKWLQYLQMNNQEQAKELADLKSQIQHFPAVSSQNSQFEQQQQMKIIQQQMQNKLEAFVDDRIHHTVRRQIQEESDYIQRNISTQLANQQATVQQQVSTIQNTTDHLAQRQMELRLDLQNKTTNSPSIQPVLSKIEELKAKMEAIEASQLPLKQNIQSTTERLETLEKPRYNFREKLLKKITRSSKEHIKNIIRNLIIKYRKISALQLREIVVEEQGLTSKSSFYRNLEELELEEGISVVHEGKEKKYAYEAFKQPEQ